MSNQITAEGVSPHPYVSHPDLSGASVFITGGGSGIGAYLVHAFSRQGARVAFISLDADRGESLCSAVEANCDVRPWFQACDVRNVADLQACVGHAQDRHGPITVLINNAARDDRHDLATLSAEAWDNLIATNLRPYFYTAQAALAGMRTAGRGSIINLGSNSANLGLAGYPAYVTAKSGIVGMTRALARELGPAGIRVNALIPGWVMTERQKSLWVTESALAQCLAEQSLKDTIRGEDVAEAALFLASSSSRMITGQSLIVDGGRAFD
jgi:NAD(P)-dependent dehydrogenase (short-subunit alcohol dehydrogenase family)